MLVWGRRKCCWTEHLFFPHFPPQCWFPTLKQGRILDQESSYRLFSEKTGAWEEEAKCKSISRNPLMKQPHLFPWLFSCRHTQQQTHPFFPTYMVADSCSRKGELLGLCPSNSYKTNRHLQNIPMEGWIPMECIVSPRKRPLWTGKTGRKAHSVRCSQYLQREILGLCTGGSKAHEKKHSQEEKSQRGAQQHTENT